MSDMILLGAGASRDADIPTAFDMSLEITREFARFASLYPGRYTTEIYQFANFVVGGMLLRQGQMGANPLNGVNVEELFQAIGLIKDKNKIAVSGLITWHPEIEAFLRKKRELSTDAYDEFFSQVARFFARALINLTSISDPAKVSYLEPLLRPLAHQKKLVVATLNYDCSFEIMAEANSQPYISVINDLSVLQQPQGLFLIKVHGSIDWKSDYPLTTPAAPVEVQTVQQATALEMQQPGYSPGIIFGAGNKLTAEGPYLGLLRAFQQELDNVTKLTIVGYSFADEHINEFIGRWLNADVSHILTIVDPSFPNTNNFLQRLHASCLSRITHIAEPANIGLALAFP